MDDSLRVLLVDDHALVRRGVRMFMETQPGITIVGEASTGEEAVAFVETDPPDIVLMDLILPGISGVEATRRIKATSPGTQVIALTSSQEPEHVLPVLRAGATAYLLKDVGPDELERTIKRAAGGEVVIEARIAAQMVASLRQDSSPANGRAFADLTARETEVLRLVAEGRNNAEIAAHLFISEKTVKTHIGNILGKLQLADRTQAAVLAWREGLMKSE